jgi:hypothetical protein
MQDCKMNYRRRDSKKRNKEKTKLNKLWPHLLTQLSKTKNNKLELKIKK